eukprot:scaffold1239_cov175-Pinguiococcus_pyrenoidosus.AAC.1
MSFARLVLQLEDKKCAWATQGTNGWQPKAPARKFIAPPLPDAAAAFISTTLAIPVQGRCEPCPLPVILASKMKFLFQVVFLAATATAEFHTTDPHPWILEPTASPTVGPDGDHRRVLELGFCEFGVLNDCGNVCCDASLCGGTCGGCACADQPGGPAECCPKAIRENGIECNLPEDTGCVVSDIPCEENGTGCDRDDVETYYPLGVQTDVPARDVVGWEICDISNYGVGTGPRLDELLSKCNKAYLMLACRAVANPSVYHVLAATTREDALLDTGTGDAFSSTISNGAQWYFAEDWSWGFAPLGRAIRKNQCDLGDFPSYETDRLCWHTIGSVGGWRCGGNIFLNSGSTPFEKLRALDLQRRSYWFGRFSGGWWIGTFSSSSRSRKNDAADFIRMSCDVPVLEVAKDYFWESGKEAFSAFSRRLHNLTLPTLLTASPPLEPSFAT